MARLEQLHKLLEKTPADPFISYGIALELKKAGQLQEAVEWLDRTITLDQEYCYAYYQKGQVLEQLGDTSGARLAYQEGIKAAQSAADPHAESELRGAMDLL
jgi:tetratricopeptide (TPR) repeat protein